MQCVSSHDQHQCHHQFGHSGKHYAVWTDSTGRNRSSKWTSTEATHLAIGDEQLPVEQTEDVMRSARAASLVLANYATVAGISIDQARTHVDQQLATAYAVAERG